MYKLTEIVLDRGSEREGEMYKPTEIVLDRESERE